MYRVNVLIVYHYQIGIVLWGIDNNSGYLSLIMLRLADKPTRYSHNLIQNFHLEKPIKTH